MPLWDASPNMSCRLVDKLAHVPLGHGLLEIGQNWLSNMAMPL